MQLGPIHVEVAHSHMIGARTDYVEVAHSHMIGASCMLGCLCIGKGCMCLGKG